MLRVLSACAGIGGFELGFDERKYKVVGQIENNSFCIRVLEQHWPNVPKWKDCTSINPEELPDHDVFIAGFPCQPHSNAGNKKSTDDERWLWPSLQKIIEIKRPRYIALENVPGLLTTNKGRAFREILTGLSQNRYDAQWLHLRASDFGYIHKRKRIFLVAYPSGIRLERHIAETLRRRSRLQRWSDCRSASDFRKRPDLPKPLFLGGRDGIPNWVDRIKAIGNAIVPDKSKLIADYILYIEEQRMSQKITELYDTLKKLNIEELARRAEMMNNPHYKNLQSAIDSAEAMVKNLRIHMQELEQDWIGEIEKATQETEARLREAVEQYYIENQTNAHDKAYASWRPEIEIMDESAAVQYAQEQGLSDILKINIAKQKFNQAVKDGRIDHADWWVKSDKLVVTVKGLGDV